MAPPDRLAKRLYTFLAMDIPYEELAARGCTTFIAFDRPNTEDPAEMAAAAFVYLFGQVTADRAGHAFARCMAFVCSQTGKPFPNARAIKQGHALATAANPSQADLEAWFRAHCC